MAPSVNYCGCTFNYILLNLVRWYASSVDPGGDPHMQRRKRPSPVARYAVRRHRTLGSRSTLSVAVGTVTALAVLDAVTGPRLVVIGLLAVGPCLAAMAARPGAVAAVGLYALVLTTILAWGPDQIGGSAHALLYMVATVAITAISVTMAAHRCRMAQYANRTLVSLRTAESIIRCSDDAIIGKTLDGTITDWNPGAENLYGYPATEAVGMDIRRLAGPGGPAEIEGVLSRITAGEHVAHYETKRTRRDGSTVDVSVSISPIRNRAGTIVGASVVARDITARKRQEEHLRKIEERFQQDQRLQSLGQLAGGVAHDFNNLLTAIIGFADLLTDQISGDHAAGKNLARIHSAAQRATELTRQLMLFSRGEVICTQTMDLNTAVTDALGILSRTLGENIEVIERPTPQPLLIDANSGQIQQVIINLAINARDAMPNGGILVIQTDVVTLAEPAEYDLHPPLPAGRYVQLLVSDTGQGMSREVAAHIFEPFYTTKAIGKGTGLGLAIVYGIVTDAGGSISVYSEVNMGTTFRTYLPIVQGRIPSAEIPSVVQPEPGHGQTILLVEDDEDIRQVVTRILDHGGYRVLSAASGAEALEFYRSESCHLLLTDVVMPEMTGPHLGELLRERDPNLPILYMSGYNPGLLTRDHTRAEGTGFIEKPFSVDGLLSRIQALLTHAESLITAVPESLSAPTTETCHDPR